MTSIGYLVAKAVLGVAMILVARESTPNLGIALQQDTPVAFEESAFETELYHHLLEPYRSFKCMPRRIHLSQASNVDSTNHLNWTVSFTLDYQNCKHVKPFVLYGRQLDRAERATAEKQVFNFSSSRTGTYYQSDFIYHVELPNLEAGRTQYWYRVEVEEAGPSTNVRTARYLRETIDPVVVVASTPTLTFQTPPSRGTPTTLAFLGDLGQTGNSTKTMNYILRATNPFFHLYPVSMIMIVGDMSYADGDPHRWTSWLDLMEPLFRSTPVEVAAGNHEVECDNITLDIFIPYENFFHNANQLGKAETKPIDRNYLATLWNKDCATPSQFEGHYNFGNAFYAFQHGLVQMIVLSSYSETNVGSPQYQFLERELASVDRRLTPWLIVTFHCPFYTTFAGHDHEIQSRKMRDAMEPLFVMYGVNLVFSGHDHAYLRTRPMAYGKSDEDGPIYFIVGAGGNREGHSHAYLNDEPEEWVAVRDRFEYGYGNLFVPNATHAQFKWVRDGTTNVGAHDDVWLTNNHV